MKLLFRARFLFLVYTVVIQKILLHCTSTKEPSTTKLNASENKHGKANRHATSGNVSDL